MSSHAAPDAMVGRTVGGVLQSVFPEGTSDSAEDGFEPCPEMPSDVFAAVGLLMERSGAYSALRIGGRLTRDRHDPNEHPVLWLSASTRDLARDTGQAWSRSEGKVPSKVVEWWNELIGARNQPVFVDPSASLAPAWWLPALCLLIAADEAADGVGYRVTETEMKWFALLFFYAASKDATGKPFQDAFGEQLPIDRRVYTITVKASPDVVCVLPKSRTAPVGTTLRSLSHNLALLPARGVVRTRWYPQRTIDPHDDSKEMNILLVPFPFSISARSFKGQPIRHNKAKLGWFHVDQTWLPADSTANKAAFVVYIDELIKAAEADIGEGALHGVVFPELSLNWAYYDALRTSFSESRPNIEFLIAGLADFPVSRVKQNGDQSTRSDRTLVKGNYAVTCCFVPGSANRKPQFLEYSRPKHHRWKLDETQITRYALGAALDPSIGWWEDISLTWRELDVAVLRESGTVTTLICEDLARLDPSQAALRAIGPNLVTVLLMDGPQLTYRWAARNATVLAEDPGSSVLTLTSMGLIDRINKNNPKEESRCVGLWRDDRGQQEVIEMAKGADAVLITLSSTKKTEWTLDGREDSCSSLSWHLSGKQPITANDPTRRPPWIKPT